MKLKNTKRFATAAVAGAMALSMTAPAFAAETATNITGSYRAITLNVSVPTTGAAIINPYGLPYELGDSTISGQQITTGAPLLIQNKSVVPLSVSASAVGVVKGAFEFATTAPADTETKKAGLVKVQMFAANGVTEANATDTEVLNQKFAALPDDSDDPAKDIVVGLTSASQDDILTLKSGNASGELVDGGAAFFRLSGAVAKKPTTDWATTDGFSVKVAFTFEPTVATASAGTIAAAGGSAVLNVVDTANVATLTPDLPTGVTVSDWTWSSSDTAVATVAEEADDKSATVTRVATGTVTITVSGTGSDGTVYSASIEYTVS